MVREVERRREEKWGRGSEGREGSDSHGLIGGEWRKSGSGNSSSSFTGEESVGTEPNRTEILNLNRIMPKIKLN